mmetsp:Transcript_116512/g.290948  ORF Transcript_116512/g.290948 Transcript_116512/m.290948 type:complete len:133 (-) Transcript_116512:393-791(-)
MGTSCVFKKASMNSTVSKSMWFVGSSKRMRSGLLRMILPNATLICHPPESSPSVVSRRPPMPSAGRSASAASRLPSAISRSLSRESNLSSKVPSAVHLSISASMAAIGRSSKSEISSWKVVRLWSRAASCFM